MFKKSVISSCLILLAVACQSAAAQVICLDNRQTSLDDVTKQKLAIDLAFIHLLDTQNQQVTTSHYLSNSTYANQHFEHEHYSLEIKSSLYPTSVKTVRIDENCYQVKINLEN
ncbi:hypothetical protein L0B53_18960 (plasmid) [Vibrio sp. SS-MA-C1-2]|uniref:hypothetical protein n=1 Tax=Vibrio sp. SS-MA-C1-2 TaxID=2908646 RepID=UPI001F3D704C|nr:hypothetical protein [Vibrio sp. SS-MA-C1-2]UJF20217.1 hypothetical protein L0B53_18960 [Vibrio sp. SS-MA-C1-2]